MQRVLGWFVVCVLCLGVAPVCAQSESGAAAVAGTVLDPDGKTVAAATVTLRNSQTGYVREVMTDAAGRFAAQVMPVGEYVIEAQARGTARARQTGLRLEVGQTAQVSLSLSLAQVSEAVTVSADALRVDASEAAVATNIPSRAVELLPIRGRNFAEFAQLSPGIMQESDRAGMVVAGQRSINSNVSIDGADFNDPLQGNQRGGNEAVFFFPQAAVREFQVVRNGLGAEVGRTSAGFVNVVTKSGTNTTRGDLSYFNRNRALTSKDAFDRKLNNQQNQFAVSMGGALKKDRAFYFAALEQNYLRVPFVVKFQTQAANVVVPDSLKALEGEKHGTNDPTALFLRTDYQLSPTQNLNVQYTYSRLDGRNFNFESAQLDAAESANYTRKNTSNGLKASLVSVLGASLVNEAKGQVATDNRDELPNTNTPQAVITGFGTLGGDTGRPRAFRNIRYQASDNMTLIRGAHQLRFGLDLNVTDSEQERESNTLGRYDYTSLNNYINGVVSRYRQTVASANPDDLVYRGTQKEAAAYVQDKVHAGRATLTMGLRWEGQWNPQPPRPNPAVSYTQKIPNDLKMWQPRLGLTVKLDKSGGSVLKMSSGYYAARTPANLFQRVFTDNGITALTVDSRTDSSILALVGGGQALTTLPVGLKVPVQRIFGFDPNFQNPRTAQSSITLEHQFSDQFVVSAGYINAIGRFLQRRLDRNLFQPTYNAAGMPIYPTTRPNPAFAAIEVNESTARSRYDGLALTATHRTARLLVQANYTYALNKDDDSNERNFSREVTLDVFNTAAEYTWSKQDIRHNFNISSVVDLPGGFTASAIVLARTGLPYTAVTGSDTQNDGNDDNDRAIINGVVTKRNEFRQPSFFNMDLRLQKALSLAGSRRVVLMLEVFNATRAKNLNFGVDGISVYGTNPAAPVATAGQALSAPSTARFGGARQVQLGLKFGF